MPGPRSPGIDVGDIRQQRDEGYQRIGLHLQDIGEYISLAEEADHRRQPHLGLVVDVDSHEFSYHSLSLISLSCPCGCSYNAIIASMMPEAPLKRGH